MALNALTLSTTQGVQGRPFQATISGLTTGRVEVLGDASPGFSVVNGNLMSRGLPYPVSTVALREYEPGVGQGYRDSRIDITATTRDQLQAQALAALGPGRSLVRYRTAGTRQGDGSIAYSIYVEDDLGATTVRSTAQLAQRLVPADANTFWVMAPNGYGTANGYKFIRGNSAGYGATDLGGSSPAWRLSGVVEFASVSVDPTSATRLGLWSEDIGAQDVAMQAVNGGPFGNSFHGIGSGGSIAQNDVRADGAAVSPSAVATGNQFSVVTDVNVVFATGQTARIVSTVTINNDGTIDKTNRIVSGASFVNAYAQMNIANGNFTEAFVGNSSATLAGFKADMDYSFLPGFTTVRTRNPDTGYVVTETSNAPSQAGFSRDEVRPSGTIGSRMKVYYRFTGTPGDITVTGKTAYTRGAAGASTFNASVLTNGGFDNGITGWTETQGGAGSSPVVSGKVRQTSNSGSQIKLTQLAPGLDTASYYAFAYDVAISGSAPVAGDLIAGLGINTNGSMTGALGVIPAIAAGRNLIVFQPTQAQLQVILGLQQVTTGRTVADWDNVSLAKLAA